MTRKIDRNDFELSYSVNFDKENPSTNQSKSKQSTLGKMPPQPS